MSDLPVKTMLVIDDDQNLCETIKDYFSSDSFRVMTAGDGKKGLDICAGQRIDIVLLDQKLPGTEGHLLCPEILRYNDNSKIIFITAHASFDHAVTAIKAGAFDYLSKPFEIEELELAIVKALRHSRLERIELFQTYQHQKQFQETTLVGRHPSFLEIEKLISVAARSDVPVLITGETGVGKSVVAKQIHYSSPLRSNPFISINCNSLPDHLFEAELFGHERGAFTDAQKARKGIFTMAEEGTLMLDEIGCMPLHLQSKLLTVLDEKKFKRLGCDNFVSVNVRIIAATNADLQKSISDKTFREDLYYRINVIRIHIPPLRERLDDLEILSRYLLDQICPGRNLQIDPSDFNAMKTYPWPGNVRELKNILERAVIFQEEDKIRPSLLLHHGQSVVLEQKESVSDPGSSGLQPVLPMSEVEKQQILNALTVYNGNMSRAAKDLEISLSTLKRKVKQYSVSLTK